MAELASIAAMIIAILAAVGLQSAPSPVPAPAPAGATVVSPAIVTAAADAKAKDPVTCREEAPIGSLLKRKVCVRHSAVEARARESQVQMDRLLSGAVVPTPK